MLELEHHAQNSSALRSKILNTAMTVLTLPQVTPKVSDVIIIEKLNIPNSKTNSYFISERSAQILKTNHGSHYFATGTSQNSQKYTSLST